MSDEKQETDAGLFEPTSGEVRFRFENREASSHFLHWLCGQGEQDYWPWMELREKEEPGQITGLRFRYHKPGHGIVDVECGRWDEGPRLVTPEEVAEQQRAIAEYESATDEERQKRGAANLALFEPTSGEVTFRFENQKAASLFLHWLSRIGEQQYWEWMDYREKEETGSITGVVFKYHEPGHGVVTVECGRNDDEGSDDPTEG